MAATSSTVSSLDLEGKPKPKGAILFTGPDGINDHRVTVEEQYYVGHGTRSPESTSDATYLCRAPQAAPHPLPKASLVGAVGWGIPSNVDHSILKSGHQIKLKEFRSAVEDRHTHLYQTPYYPPPNPLSTTTTANGATDTNTSANTSTDTSVNTNTVPEPSRLGQSNAGGHNVSSIPNQSSVEDKQTHIKNTTDFTKNQPIARINNQGDKNTPVDATRPSTRPTTSTSNNSSNSSSSSSSSSNSNSSHSNISQKSLS